MPLNAKTDFTAILKDADTNKELLRFRATASSDLILTADFQGGGIASAGQSMTISTEREFEYKTNAQTVEIFGRTFILSSVTVSFRKPLGARGKMKKVYILELQ